MVCASPEQPQAAPLSPTNPFSCPDKINMTHGGGAPLGTTCVGEFGLNVVPCGFPFTYGGKTNYQCTSQDSSNGAPWCYKVDDAKASNFQTCTNVSSTRACQVIYPRPGVGGHSSFKRAPAVPTLLPALRRPPQPPLRSPSAIALLSSAPAPPPAPLPPH
jgi:hypothetical protein